MNSIVRSVEIKKLWNDDCGGIISSEYVMLAATLVVGTVGGLVAMRQALVKEWTEMAESVSSLDQSFYIPGQSSREGKTAGSSYREGPCD